MPMNASAGNWKAKYKEVTKFLESKGFEVSSLSYEDNFGVKPPPFKQKVNNIPVAYLGNALHRMSVCDAVYFCNGWDKARGCLVEHMVAKNYDIPTFYEGEDISL